MDLSCWATTVVDEERSRDPGDAQMGTDARSTTGVTKPGGYLSFKYSFSAKCLKGYLAQFVRITLS